MGDTRANGPEDDGDEGDRNEYHPGQHWAADQGQHSAESEEGETLEEGARDSVWHVVGGGG